MLKKINKNKFYAYFFVVVSLMAFLFLFGFYFVVCFNNYYNRIMALNNNAVAGSKEHSRQLNVDISDPYITKVINSKDTIKEPILRAEDPVFGFVGAPITVFIYSDYDCAYCAKQLEMIKTSVAKHENKVRLIWKDYPETNFDSLSYRAAVAARCAGEQGLFWKYNKGLFAESENLNQDVFEKIALEAGLNVNTWQSCLSEASIKKLINDNIFEADALLINGVPFVYVNNRGYLGGIEAGELDDLIERELDEN